MVTRREDREPVRRNFFRGMALMRSEKTKDDGLALIKETKIGDLKWLAKEAEQRAELLARVTNVFERHVTPERDRDRTVVEILRRAAKAGDQEAVDLLVSDELDNIRLYDLDLTV
jgi:hypothetical protein